MKKLIVLIMAAAVVCSLCACTASGPNTSGSASLSEVVTDIGTSESGLDASNSTDMSGNSGATGVSDETGSTSGLAQTGDNGEGPATLSFGYVTVQIPKGMSYEVGGAVQPGTSGGATGGTNGGATGGTNDGTTDGIFLMLREADREETRTFLVCENNTVQSAEDAVAECVRMNSSNDKNEITYGDDLELGDVTYKQIHIVQEDGSAEDYLVAYRQSGPSMGYYVEMKTEDYPTGSAVMPLDDPMVVSFLESVRFTTSR